MSAAGSGKTDAHKERERQLVAAALEPEKKAAGVLVSDLGQSERDEIIRSDYSF
jgi:hypothetical protein